MLGQVQDGSRILKSRSGARERNVEHICKKNEDDQAVANYSVVGVK